jgi:membrane-bound lytic murein transglycosylase D
MMYVKFIILSVLTTILITASDPFFGTIISFSPIPKDLDQDVIEKSWMSTDAFLPYLTDKDNKVSDTFFVNPYFYPTVHFWFLIYTQFESTSIVIHDKNNLSLIYKVLDFSSLKKKGLSNNTLYILQQKISAEKLKDLKASLDHLSKDPFSLSLPSKKIYRILKNANIQLPVGKKERSQFFTRLHDNMRTQTGQKNFIRDGIIRSLPYQKFLTDYFERKQLPKELLAIPFLESSFNPKAQSKVNALGIWQFMPLISTYYVPKRTNDFDYRFNVGVASVAAGFLMTENIQIMKSWDLAVTAYNSGPKHLLKTRRELGRKKVTLEEVIAHSDSQHFGFASKNFYSEFLALAHTLAYREELFDDLHGSDRSDVDKNIRFFLTKCPLKLKKELTSLQLDDVYFHNHHTAHDQDKVPRGFILISKSVLPIGKFFEIPKNLLLKTKPKEWEKTLKRQSCSTR